MSDPVTNAQIEDVLSSIRRLVSEDNRAETPADAGSEPAAEPGAEDADNAQGQADRLVLTPALRVNTAESAGETGPEKTGPAAMKLGRVEPDQREAEKSPGVPPWATPDATLFGAVGGEDAPATFPHDATGEAPAADFAARDDGAEAVMEAAAGEVEAMPEVDAAADVTSDAAGDAPAEDVEDDTPLTFHSTRAESLSAKIAALEEVIGRTRDQWEPDGASDDAYAGRPVAPLAWPDGESGAAPADTRDAAEPDADATAAPAEAGTDEAVIDEDSLRELVAEIVREELQGALGERITRNVRKLVRREIHRALAAQDLD